MAAAGTERVRCSGELCVLRLVGLALPAADRLHVVLLVGQRPAYRGGGVEERREDMDVAERRAKPWHPGDVQVLRLLCRGVCATVPFLVGWFAVAGDTASGHLFLHIPGVVVFDRCV